jgi:uncharacterized protein (DUF924 family)
MGPSEDWRALYDYWFPPGLAEAGPDRHRAMFEWWFAGGGNAGLVAFAALLPAARSGRLGHWKSTPAVRLSLILVLDQLPRALFAGSADAYACDADALRAAEDGLRTGQYDALHHPWERLFFALPLAHAEGPDHLRRLDRVVALADRAAREAPAPLRPLYRFSASQARGHRDVIARFGRFPHRNAILGRASIQEETAYLVQGDFVHRRRPPDA